MPVTEFKSTAVGRGGCEVCDTCAHGGGERESLLSEKQVTNCVRGQGGLHHAKADVSVGSAGLAEVCKGAAVAGRRTSTLGSRA